LTELTADEAADLAELAAAVTSSFTELAADDAAETADSAVVEAALHAAAAASTAVPETARTVRRGRARGAGVTGDPPD
jgi:hypothetical protein